MQIREHAQAHPDKPAVIMHPSGARVTFGELEARANRLAHYFRRHGLREGDAVAILMENNEHYHAVMWAARRCGLYYVPINTHLTAAEAAYIIDNSSAKAIVGSAAGTATPNALPTNQIRRSAMRSRATSSSTRRVPPVGRRASSASCSTCRLPRCRA
jgi:acyl-CoA synthetase (AMP-forming)/AMP-acid ligase II